MSQNDKPHLSLLSLSIAAASAAPIPAESAARFFQGAATNTTKHRRLSSTGRSRRRLSDARDAATRPFPTSLQTASASLAALSLSPPATPSHCSVTGAQPIQVPRVSTNVFELEPVSLDDTHLSVSPPQSHTHFTPNSIHITKSGRKRGTLFTCESCSKVYRHPSCLIKHRWEHTPQWREASKFVLSKHQQVQLLEAAAILSHLSPSSASLPEDRSLWPSFLSGGLVPPPASMSNSDVGPTPPTTTTTATSPPASVFASNDHASFPTSSSVPASTVSDSYRAGPTGPRLHDYAISGGGIGITQVRPGMLGVPTEAISATTEDDALNLLSLREACVTSRSYESPTSGPSSHSHSHSHVRSYSHVHVHSRPHVHVHAHSHSLSHPPSHIHSLSFSHASREERRRSNAYEYGVGYDYRFGGSSGYPYVPDSNGTWSLPRSSVRSKSGSSGSRSRSQSVSESRSDEEEEEEEEGMFGDGVDVGGDLDQDGDGDVQDMVEGGVKAGRKRVYGPRVRAWRAEDGEGEKAGRVGREGEQTWDDMEMEMEMD